MPRRASPWSRLLWLPILGLAIFTGWLWYRAAFGPGGGGGGDPALAEASEPAGPPLPGVTTGEPGESELPSPPPASPAPGPGGVEIPAMPPVFDLPTHPIPAVPVPPPTPVTNGPGPEPALRLSTERLVAMQLALARRGISSGSVDGVAGSQTRAALRVFQKAEGLPASGEPDAATWRRLGAESPAYATYTVTAEDLAGLAPVPRTWAGKAGRTNLGYESVLELVAERSRSHPKLVRALNPDVDWQQVRPGRVVRVPAAEAPAVRGRAAFVRISLSEKTLRAFDASSNLLVHFPCSIAAKVEKRPVGTLKVARLAPNPNYRFDPEIFPESAEARKLKRKLMIPPGPNNPVGTAWIGLDRPGYGIHGTPNPEEVGRTESHGCFRLSNWNAEHLLRLAWVGMPVHVER